jgi:hypothetical protein
MRHRDVRRGRGVALGGQADPFLPSRTMPTTAQVGNSSLGRRRTALRGQTTPQGHPPAPPTIATRAPSTTHHYSPSVAFAMMFRWISFDPA